MVHGIAWHENDIVNRFLVESSQFLGYETTADILGQFYC
jgi:hypothetical protein